MMSETIELTRKDFVSSQTVRWCPGVTLIRMTASSMGTSPGEPSRVWRRRTRLVEEQDPVPGVELHHGPGPLLTGERGPGARGLPWPRRPL